MYIPKSWSSSSLYQNCTNTVCFTRSYSNSSIATHHTSSHKLSKNATTSLLDTPSPSHPPFTALLISTSLSRFLAPSSPNALWTHLDLTPPPAYTSGSLCFSTLPQKPYGPLVRQPDRGSQPGTARSELPPGTKLAANAEAKHTTEDENHDR